MNDNLEERRMIIMNCSNYSNVNKEDHNFGDNCDGEEDAIKKC